MLSSGQILLPQILLFSIIRYPPYPHAFCTKGWEVLHEICILDSDLFFVWGSLNFIYHTKSKFNLYQYIKNLYNPFFLDSNFLYLCMRVLTLQSLFCSQKMVLKISGIYNKYNFIFLIKFIFLCTGLFGKLVSTFVLYHLSIVQSRVKYLFPFKAEYSVYNVRSLTTIKITNDLFCCGTFYRLVGQ